MKVTCCVTCAFALAFPPIISGAAPEKTLSPSRQFILYGTDVGLRGAISRLAEETKTNLLALLRRSDSWKTPIVIALQFPQANVPETPPAALHFGQTGSGLKLQLDLTILSNFKSIAVERELLRAILLEIIYREQPDIAAGTEYVDPPDWLLDGVLATAAGSDSQPLAEALEPLVVAGEIMPLSDLFRPRKLSGLDSPGRLLYRSYSAVLVKWLLDQPEGRARLGQYIDNLSHASNDPLAELKVYFPALNEDVVEKTWRARVAQFCASQSYQLLTFGETERKLNELLSIKTAEPAAPSSTAFGLEDLSLHRISPAQSQALTQLSQALMLLGVRANPILRPVIAQYQQIAMLLAAGKNSGLSERLARLRVLRGKIAARMSKIDDYLNWFEATQAPTKSGEFANYLNAAERQSETAPRRHDALSVYLDALEEQFKD